MGNRLWEISQKERPLIFACGLFNHKINENVHYVLEKLLGASENENSGYFRPPCVSKLLKRKHSSLSDAILLRGGDETKKVRASFLIDDLRGAQLLEYAGEFCRL